MLYPRWKAVTERVSWWVLCGANEKNVAASPESDGVGDGEWGEIHFRRDHQSRLCQSRRKIVLSLHDRNGKEKLRKHRILWPRTIWQLLCDSFQEPLIELQLYTGLTTVNVNLIQNSDIFSDKHCILYTAWDGMGLLKSRKKFCHLSSSIYYELFFA